MKMAELSAMIGSLPNFTQDMSILCRRSQMSQLDEKSLKAAEKRIDNGALWIGEPTSCSIIVYSVVIPVISALGIIGNGLILAVHSRGTLKASTYTYLAVLAAADIVTCVLLLFSGLARGVFWCRAGWLEFDAFVHLPVGSVSSNITVWAAVCVTIDRLAIVCGPPRCKPPKFCHQQVARKLMIYSSFLATLINIPYCFIYTYDDLGNLVTTEFFHSSWYNLQNWLQLMVFGLMPAAFLLIANGIMCRAVRKALKQRQQLLRRKNIREGNRLRDQARLTVMLVGIVFMFVVGEVPTHLASRRSAVSLLYGGDPTKVHVHFIERFRMCATVLNAFASSANFVLYCLLSPHFLANLKRLLAGKPIVDKQKTIVARMTLQRTESPRCEVFVL